MAITYILIKRVEDSNFDPALTIPEAHIISVEEAEDINGKWELGQDQDPRERDLIEVETISGNINYITLEYYQFLGGE